MKTCIHQRYRNVPLMMIAVISNLLFSERDREIGIHCLILEEVSFDVIGSISETKQKIVKPMMRVRLEQMPQDREPANFNHWLRPELRFFAQTCTQAPAENHGLHIRGCDKRYSLYRSNAAHATGTGIADSNRLNLNQPVKLGV